MGGLYAHDQCGSASLVTERKYEAMHFGLLDSLIFFGYFIGVVGFVVVIAARSKTKDSSADYFLASRKLPWYVVGASLVASNISTEHFIGMVGLGFLYGIGVANWEWGTAIPFSALIWIFLPFYMRGNVTTMPEFLERRFNKASRYIYALIMIVGLVIAMLGGVLFAGAKAINVFFPGIPLEAGVLLLAVVAGTYTIYGGLLSAVWADLLQYCLLMVGGLVVTVFGLHYAGGLGNLMETLPEKFILFYSPTHEMLPWTGVVLGLFSVGIWYNCANQFLVQRCLAARSEWDARMGVVMAGFSKALLPFIVVVPGIVAFHLFQDRISDGDQAWPFMVQEFLPAGFTGLVLVGLVSAIMSTISAITNSSSTIFTLDLYKELIHPFATDKQLHRVGRISAALILLVGVGVALLLTQMPCITVFGLIQKTFFYMAAPISACFMIGILWRGATSAAAMAAMTLGFLVYTPLVCFALFPKIPALVPYDTFTHHTFVVVLLSGATLILVSLVTKRKSEQELEGVIWSFEAMRLPATGENRRHGNRSLVFWWAVMVSLIIGLCTVTALRGNQTKVVEVEKCTYYLFGGTAEIQPRGSLPNFNMWTGSGQVRFQPSAINDRIEFRLLIGKEGRYDVALLVTRGPGYGPFRIELNGQAVLIQYPETVMDGARFRVVAQTAAVYPAQATESQPAGKYFMHRLQLGTVEVSSQLELTVIAEGTGAIGIDQIIFVRQKAGHL